MVDSVQKDGQSAESVRVNVGLTKECMQEIDELIAKIRLFNSRSEFITAALRNLMFNYERVADETIKQMTKTYGNTEEALNKYYQQMEILGRKLEERYKEKFGANVDVQIAIRLNQRFYDRITSMDDLSPKGIQPLCRMAIVQYCKYIGDQAMNHSFRSSSLRYLRNKAKECSVESEIMDPLKRWDDLADKHD